MDRIRASSPQELAEPPAGRKVVGAWPYPLKLEAALASIPAGAAALAYIGYRLHEAPRFEGAGWLFGLVLGAVFFIGLAFWLTDEIGSFRKRPEPWFRSMKEPKR